jgi:hypothetical protein
MVENRRGGSANAEQSAWGPQSEKHISLDGISDAISEIFPALFQFSRRCFMVDSVFLMMMLDL